jgi:hypothetical protein
MALTTAIYNFGTKYDNRVNIKVKLFNRLT